MWHTSAYSVPNAISKDCLKDADISIRKRALDVTYSLVDETNIKSGSQLIGSYRREEHNECFVFVVFICERKQVGSVLNTCL